MVASNVPSRLAAHPRPTRPIAIEFHDKAVRHTVAMGGWHVGFAVVFVLLAGALAARAELPAGVEAAAVEGQWQKVLDLLKPADAKDAEVQFWQATAHLGLGGDANVRQARVLTEQLRAKSADRSVLQLHAQAKWGTILRKDPMDVGYRHTSDPQVNHLIGAYWLERRDRLVRYWEEVPPGGRSPKAAYMAGLALLYLRAAEAVRAEPFPANDRLMGFALLAKDRPGEAVEYFERAAAAAPMGWETYLVYAEAVTRTAGVAAGTTLFDHAAALAPAAAVANTPAPRAIVACRRGDTLLALGHAHAALAAYRQSMGVQSSYPYIRRKLGIAALAAGDIQLALWAFGANTQVHNSSAEDTYWTGRCAYALGKDAWAVQLLQKAVKDATTLDEAAPAEWRHYLGRALEGVGQADAAIAHLDAAAAAAPREPLFARWALQAFVQRGDYNRAAVVCRRLAVAGEPALALTTLDALLKKLEGQEAPQGARGALLRARAAAFERQQRYAMAAHSYELAGEKTERSRDAEFGWALLLSRQKDAAGVVLARAATGQGPLPDRARLGLGVLRMNEEKLDEAAELFRGITTPEWADARDVGLFQIAFRKGQREAWNLVNPLALLGIMFRMPEEEGAIPEVVYVPAGAYARSLKPQLMPGDRIEKVVLYYPTRRDMKTDPRWREAPGALSYEMLVGRGDQLHTYDVKWTELSVKLRAIKR